MPEIRLHIDLGHILTILGMLVMFAVGYGRYTTDMATLQAAVREQKAQIATLEVRVAEMNVRLARMDVVVDAHVRDDKVLKPSDVHPR